MKFLLDENLPPSFSTILQELGYDALHVCDVNLNHTLDSKIVSFAAENDYTIITNDLDFSRIIALGNLQVPSVITFRLSKLNKIIFEEVISLNLPDLANALHDGSLITIDDKKIRIQNLPVQKRK